MKINFSNEVVESIYKLQEYECLPNVLECTQKLIFDLVPEFASAELTKRAFDTMRAILYIKEIVTPICKEGGEV